MGGGEGLKVGLNPGEFGFCSDLTPFHAIIVGGPP